MARLLIVAVSLISSCYAYPDGAPVEACATMTPNHGSTNTFSAPPNYDIASACYVIFPNDFMSIRIWDRNNVGSFRGVFMQVRNSTGQISGTWSTNNNANLQQVNCNSVTNTAVTHTSSSLKNGTDTTAVWTAPASCAQNEEFEIRATVVRAFSQWTKVTVPLVCDPDYSNVAVMERVRPPLKVQYCAQGSWAILPTRATTSFETVLKAGGWRHLYGGSGFRFRRKSGATPSANTGPTAAQDGSYYMYYEATGRKAGDMAGLLSPFGMQGCFCFSFYCHMNTDGETRFTLRTIGEDQTEIMSTTAAITSWTRVAFSVVSSRPAVFLFQVFSSGNDRGDVGLDNIKFAAGPCSASSDGYGGVVQLT